MSRVLWSSESKEELDAIWDYITQNAGTPEPADRFIASLRERATSYARQPEMGTHHPEYDPRIRSFTVGRYVLFYVATDDGIEIQHVCHSARDYGSLYFGE